MYGCAITCSETSSQLRRFPDRLVERRRGDGLAVAGMPFAGSIVCCVRFAHRTSVRISIRRTAHYLPAHSRCEHRPIIDDRARPKPLYHSAMRRDRHPTPRRDDRRRRSAQTCGSAAATLTQPFGSTSSVAGGLVAALAREAVADLERLVAELHLAFEAARCAIEQAPECAAHSASLGSSRSHMPGGGADAHQPAGVEAERTERTRALDHRSASCRLMRVGANVISSGMPAARTARQAACAAASDAADALAGVGRLACRRRG